MEWEKARDQLHGHLLEPMPEAALEEFVRRGQYGWDRIEEMLHRSLQPSNEPLLGDASQRSRCGARASTAKAGQAHRSRPLSIARSWSSCMSPPRLRAPR
jgi:hypothetical protein